MALWTTEKTLSLIDHLRYYPCLWDLDCPEFKNKLKKYEAYDNLGKEINLPSEIIAKKIQSLTSQFKKERRKILKKQREGGADNKRWFAYPKLKFLLKDDENGESENNMNDLDGIEELMPEVISNDEMEEVLGDSEETENNKHEMNLGSKESRKKVPALYKPKMTLKKKSSQQQKGIKKSQIKIDKRAFNCIKRLTKCLPKRDQFSIYGENIANRLRTSGKTKSEINIALHEIDTICFKLSMGFFDAPLKHLDRDSFDFYVSPSIKSSPQLNDRDLNSMPEN